jgi:cytochrome c biogenesis protein CcdA
MFNYELFSAVDRSHESSLSDARDAFINVAIDVLSAYKLTQSSGGSTSLLTPCNLRLLPLYILALLKYVSMTISYFLKEWTLLILHLLLVANGWMNK